MALSQQRVSFLLKAWSARTSTPEEEKELMDWVLDQHDPAWTQAHLDLLIATYDPAELVPATDWNALYLRIQQRAGIEKDRVIKPVKWWRWTAAAVIILVVLSGILYWFPAGKKRFQSGTEQITDVAPGKQGAILTLADGRTMVVDSLADGHIASQGKTEIVLHEGKITYDAHHNIGAQASASVVYNTMSTPRGRHYQMYLPDGTAVWLNAASSITYPVAFTGNERKVTIKGEAYLEIAGDAAHPFVVDVDSRQEIRVLGTHFNINAYPEEKNIRTTLLEGRVKVKIPTASSLLEQGEQAIYPAGKSSFIINRQPDLEEVMAWKNGLFRFQRATLEEVLRQFSRWYDVDIVYPDGIPAVHFEGEMGRDLNLTQALRGLQKMGLHYRIEDKQLIVLAN